MKDAGIQQNAIESKKKITVSEISKFVFKKLYVYINAEGAINPWNDYLHSWNQSDISLSLADVEPHCGMADSRGNE